MDQDQTVSQLLKHTSRLQKQTPFGVICSSRVKTRNGRLHWRSFEYFGLIVIDAGPAVRNSDFCCL